MIRILISLIVISTTSLAQSLQDSVNVGYTDFKTHSNLFSDVSFSNIHKNLDYKIENFYKNTTYDGSYSKNTNSFNGHLLYNFGKIGTGGKIISVLNTNSTYTKPSLNELSVMPMLKVNYIKSFFDISAGYHNKSDIYTSADGISWDVKVYSDDIFKKDYNVQYYTDYNGNNLDDNINYFSNINISHFGMITDNTASYIIGGNLSNSQYHYYETSDIKNIIQKEEYVFNGSIKYNINKKLNNNFYCSYFQRNKDTDKEDESSNFNENINLSINDEVLYNSSTFNSALKLQLNTGSDKFSIDNRDESFSFYTFKLYTQNNYSYNILNFGLNADYFKHEYKSLTLSNTEDRDIIKLRIDPYASIEIKNVIFIKQYLPLEYYHLINIASEKSGSNFTDRIVTLKTEFSTAELYNLNLNGDISLRSHFRSYDYDHSHSKSFIIKKYNFKDTLYYKFNNKIKIKLSSLYQYEEFGNLNYEDFLENPVYLKNHYYISLGFNIHFLDHININSEYYYYEIDTYEYDQTDFSKTDLKNVFIVNGPKFSVIYNYKSFTIHSMINIDLYRNKDPNYIFSVKSGYRF